MFMPDRLLLRNFQDNDVDDLIALHNDARVQGFVTNGPLSCYMPKLKRRHPSCCATRHRPDLI